MSPTTAPSSISDEAAIANLMVEYAYRNDDFDVAGLGELFAESAFTLDGQTVRGREEVVSLAGQMIHPGDDGRSATARDHPCDGRHRPLCENSGRSGLLDALRHRHGLPREALQSGRDIDTFDNSSGTWRFTKREATTLWRLQAGSVPV